MEYKELIETLNNESEWYGSTDETAAILMWNAATAITELLERAERAEKAIAEIQRARDFTRPAYVVDDILREFYGGCKS